MWERSTLAASTASGNDSVYNPNLTRNDIEAIEMECVRRAIAVPAAHNELQLTICHVRRFYVKLGNLIGASEGIKTDYILVQYENDGSVHGWPVTEKYLKLQGVVL